MVALERRGANGGRPVLGFTLVELMMVVAVLSIVASIAIPKFSNLLLKAQESSSRGNLGALRASLHIYYADNLGLFPLAGNLTSSLTTGGRYLKKMPQCHVPPPGSHSSTTDVTDYAGSYTDLGDWMYFASSGEITINCTHPDAKGQVWSTW